MLEARVSLPRMAFRGLLEQGLQVSLEGHREGGSRGYACGKREHERHLQAPGFQQVLGLVGGLGLWGGQKGCVVHDIALRSRGARHVVVAA